MQIYISDISRFSVYNLLIALFENVWRIDNSLEFVVLNARRRCELVMWELLQKINEQEFSAFLEEVESQYDKIEIINGISYWFENDNVGINIEGRFEKWKDIEMKMISIILEQDIDLYSDEYYHLHNILGLYRNLEAETDVFKEYIKKRINRKNIFRIIYDIVGHSVGSGHTYYIDSSSLKLFFDEEELKEYMRNIDVETQDEEFFN